MAASSVTLAWNPSAGTNIAGYKIYYGPASHTYTNTVNAGNTTNVVIAPLVTGATYHFAATAYDAAGLESDYSTEAVYTNIAAIPPVIVLTSPANGTSYTAPATIDLAATVMANGHTITKVQFYNGSALLGEALSAPYSFSWANVSAGNYSLAAQAVYDSGSTISSSSTSVTVAASRPQETTLAISAIASQTITTNRASLSIPFTVSDSEGDTSSFTLSASSTNTTLLSASNIVFTHNNTNYTVTLTPLSGRTGEVDITIIVSNVVSSVSTGATFHLSITEQVAWKLWWQNSSGYMANWFMKSTNMTGSAFLNPSRVDPSWKIVGTGDFNGDGEPDILLENSGGLLACWFMKGTNLDKGVYLNPSCVGSAWQIVGTGDFNADGQTDILWQHVSGWLAVWYMNGTNLTTSTFLSPSRVDPSWKVVGTGDFNGDGKVDILLENNNGLLACWLMNGSSLVEGVYLNPSCVGPGWRIVGTGDFDGDGNTDLLWQSSAGWRAVWYMNKTSLVSSTFLNPARIDSSWRIAASQ